MLNANAPSNKCQQVGDPNLENIEKNYGISVHRKADDLLAPIPSLCLPGVQGCRSGSSDGLMAVD